MQVQLCKAKHTGEYMYFDSTLFVHLIMLHEANHNWDEDTNQDYFPL